MLPPHPVLHHRSECVKRPCAGDVKERGTVMLHCNEVCPDFPVLCAPEDPYELAVVVALATIINADPLLYLRNVLAQDRC